MSIIDFISIDHQKSLDLTSLELSPSLQFSQSIMKAKLFSQEKLKTKTYIHLYADVNIYWLCK